MGRVFNIEFTDLVFEKQQELIKGLEPEIIDDLESEAKYYLKKYPLLYKDMQWQRVISIVYEIKDNEGLEFFITEKAEQRVRRNFREKVEL